jgi:hypothetical protein
MSLRRTLSRVRIVFLLALMAFSPPALAQQRTTNQGSPGPLREWPPSGAWQTILIRLLSTSDLGCVTATGYRNQTTGEQYFWGIRRTSQDTALAIVDNNPTAVAGAAIRVIVDGTPVGVFPISKRLPNGATMSVAAILPGPEAQRLISLFRLGGKVSFVTEHSTYSASLQGAQQAIANLDACAAEIAHLKPTDRSSDH